MSNDAKLGLLAGVLAVIGVAAFGLPKERNEPPKPVLNAPGSPPALPPAAVNSGAVR